MSTQEINKDNFREIYQQNDLVVIIFRADWCGPCQNFKPVYEKVAEKFPAAVFGTVDVDAEPEIADVCPRRRGEGGAVRDGIAPLLEQRDGEGRVEEEA